jgi:hypothetical protein
MLSERNAQPPRRPNNRRHHRHERTTKEIATACEASTLATGFLSLPFQDRSYEFHEGFYGNTKTDHFHMHGHSAYAFSFSFFTSFSGSIDVLEMFGSFLFLIHFLPVATSAKIFSWSTRHGEFVALFRSIRNMTAFSQFPHICLLSSGSGSSRCVESRSYFQAMA